MRIARNILLYLIAFCQYFHHSYKITRLKTNANKLQRTISDMLFFY